MEAETMSKLSSASTPREVGVAVAHLYHWNGEPICEAFLAALTDANYHALAAQLKPLIDADLNQPADLVVL
jgi:hypothetical protein